MTITEIIGIVRLNISGIVPALTPVCLLQIHWLIHMRISSNDSFFKLRIEFNSLVNVGSYNIKVSGLTSNFDNSNYYLNDTSKIDIIYNIGNLN